MKNPNFKKHNIDEIQINLVDMNLQEYLARFASLRILPEMYGEIPSSFYENLFEPPKRNDKKEIRPKRYDNSSGENNYLYWPYGDNIVYLSRKYNSLEERARNYIVRCRESDIFWRGDDIEDFKNIVSAVLKFRKLSPLEKGKYRHSVMAEAKAVRNAAHA